MGVETWTLRSEVREAKTRREGALGGLPAAFCTPYPVATSIKFVGPVLKCLQNR